MIDDRRCPKRTRDWPRLGSTGYDDMVAFFTEAFPHAVVPKGFVGQWDRRAPLFAWIEEHMGACAVVHTFDAEGATRRMHWSRGVWVFDTQNGVTQFRFMSADQAFEFKMRWG